MKVDFEALHEGLWRNGGCPNYPPEKYRIVAFSCVSEQDGTAAYDQITFELRDKKQEPQTQTST